MQATLLRPKNSPYWHIRYRFDGEEKTRQFSTNQKHKLNAQTTLAKFVREARDEACGLLAPKKQREALAKPLLEHLADMLKERFASPFDKQFRAVKYRATKVLTECGWKVAKDVKEEDFLFWRREQIRKENPAPKTLNEYLKSVRLLFNWMYKRDRIPSALLKSIDLLPRGDSRRDRRTFTIEEMERLIKTSGEVAPFFCVAFHTGLRKNEIYNLKVNDLRFDEEFPVIVARGAITKNKKRDHQPLPAESVELLRTHILNHNLKPDDYLFHCVVGKHWDYRVYYRRAGLEMRDAHHRVLDFHSIRHTFNTGVVLHSDNFREAMQLARVTDRKLLDHTYFDHKLLSLHKIVDRLPKLWHLVSPESPLKNNTSANLEKPLDTSTEIVSSLENRMNSASADDLKQNETLRNPNGIFSLAGWKPALPKPSR